MASVSADDVRDIIHVTSDDIPDAQVLKMIKRAEVTLELETGDSIDYASCTDAEKAFIENLAAIYAICYLTGGSAAGLNYSIGDLSVSAAANAPPLSVLAAEVERILKRMRSIAFIVGEDTSGLE